MYLMILPVSRRAGTVGQWCQDPVWTWKSPLLAWIPAERLAYLVGCYDTHAHRCPSPFNLRGSSICRRLKRRGIRTGPARSLRVLKTHLHRLTSCERLL